MAENNTTEEKVKNKKNLKKIFEHSKIATAEPLTKVGILQSVVPCVAHLAPACFPVHAPPTLFSKAVFVPCALDDCLGLPPNGKLGSLPLLMVPAPLSWAGCHELILVFARCQEKAVSCLLLHRPLK